MPTRPNRCEGCPDPPSNKLPIREHDLYMLDSPIIVAFLCPDCIAVDELKGPGLEPERGGLSRAAPRPRAMAGCVGWHAVPCKPGVTCPRRPHPGLSPSSRTL